MPFLWVLFLFIRHSLAESEEPGKSEKNVTLDLLAIDSSFIETFTRKPYGINTRIHVAKDGYRILSVWDGQSLLWTSSNGYCCDHVSVVRFKEKSGFSTAFVARLVAVYASDGKGAKKPLYYEKDGEKWEAVEEEKFYKSFHHEALKTSTLKNLVLNMSGENKSPEFLSSSPDFPFLVYAPNVGYRIKKVTFGTAMRIRNNKLYVMWSRSSKDEHCIYASFYPKKDPKVGYLVIETKNGLQEKFYAKTGTFGGWSTKTKEDYLTRLKQAGFKESGFNNEITTDVFNMNKSNFYIKDLEFQGNFVHFCTPCVGLRLRSIVDDDSVVWKASEETERCTFMNLIARGASAVLFILVEDPVNARKVLYFKKDVGGWSPTDKDGYYYALTEQNGLDPLRRLENQKVIMSSFTNRQGLRLISYTSKVDKPKGNVILVHGVRSHFTSEFCASRTEWNFKHLGFSMFQTPDDIFSRETKQSTNNIVLYREIFEHARLDGMDAFEVTPRYDYRHSFVEFLNGLGYNVYGFDLQSLGLSESISAPRCHVTAFKDYIYDLLQFISIVKRGKFGDPSETWDEDLIYGQIPVDKKTFLMGQSMGGNIVFQAIQKFYRNAKEGTRLVDGLIVTSGMFNVDNYLKEWNKIAHLLLRFHAWRSPEKTNAYEGFLNYGEIFELFTRYHDPFFHTNWLTFKTTVSMFSACDDVKKSENMVNYPRNLPTLFIHTRDDYICGINGPIDILERIASSEYTRLIELSGSLHYITADQPFFIIKPHIKELLDQYT
ncbi:hypothetical protein BEWA_028810 [Theileria equi strain WA]|uniref:Serine aminopeptidase S33 domain-containing protein n=1 Tax=Theileria equi strain WA TaxID=1537102 RepID=L0AYE2_THEEQ|nr:hypothetical protein BEWA_028810 [Theileria equi strain WA]AFZ80031.1 hypothetical protein BEWA_028810 [Theileria equi strain WA]|eukprot:XP_004829697.1 hypothetical protein BEWA_028810 [Theileria equi strain WA]